MEQKPTSALSKAIMISLILIVLGLITFFADIDLTNGLQYIFTVIEVAAIIWAVHYFGKQIDYNATFGKYFSHGFSIAAIITVLMVVFIVLQIFLFPDFKNSIIEKTVEQMKSNPNQNTEQAQQGLEFFKKHFMLFMVGGTLFSYIFFGTIGALIGAAITKRNPRPLMEEHIKPIE